MQIIASPPSGDNWLIPCEASTPVKDIRKQIADKNAVDAAKVKLVCEGLELEDGLTLGECFIANLSTVKVLIIAASPTVQVGAAAGAASPEPSPSSASDASSGGAGESVVTDDEALRTVIVTNIPPSDAVTTQRELIRIFSKFGPLSSLMLQDESSAAGASQRAVVVYQSQDAAMKALSVDNTFILPTPSFKEVRVTLAGNLALRDQAAANAAAGGAGGAAAGGASQRFFSPSGSNAVSRLIANGYLAGESGVASVKRFGTEKAPGVVGFGERVKVSLESAGNKVSELNAKYRVTPWLEETYNQALSSIADIDKELKVSEKVKTSASYALAQASAWARQAMRNPTVASTVTSASTFVKEASQALSATLEGAKTEIGAKRQSFVTMNPSVGVGVPVGAAAPGGEASAAAAAPAGGASSDADTPFKLPAASPVTAAATPATTAAAGTTASAGATGEASASADVPSKEATTAQAPSGII